MIRKALMNGAQSELIEYYLLLIKKDQSLKLKLCK